MTYAQARFYDPLIGRFLSTDPVYFSDDNPFTFNRYAYANNNPYKYKDPDGEDPILLFMYMSDRANQIVAEEGAKFAGHHNDAGDAMRHAETSQRFSAEFGTGLSFLAGFQHEIYGELHNNQPAAELFMDMNNNAEGRSAFSEGRPINPANLITNTDNAATNKASYALGAALGSGKEVRIGDTSVKYNSDSGKVTTSRMETGSRIPKVETTCADTSKCGK